MVSIITLEQLKKHMDISPEDEEQMLNLLGVVTSMINNELGYDLNYQIRSEKYKEDKFNPIYVRCRPLDKVEHFKINEVEQVVYKTTTRYIELDECMNYTSCYCKGNRCYRYDISYWAGIKFGTDDVPEDLIYYIALLLSDMLGELSGEDKYSSYKIDDIAYTFKETKHKKTLFDYLRRWFL